MAGVGFIIETCITASQQSRRWVGGNANSGQRHWGKLVSIRHQIGNDEPVLTGASLRILAVSSQRQGMNDYAFMRAFRRAGHSVSVVAADAYVPLWQRKSLRVLRRLLTPALVAEYNRELAQAARELQPDLFFVFKGQYVTHETLAAIKATGAVAINFYPDTGFEDHGPYLPKTIGGYDWVFTTKPVGVADLKQNYDLEFASFIPHAFDPEVHAPVQVSSHDRNKYQCDVSFIGNISDKKQKLVEHVRRNLPDINLHIWGAPKWGHVSGLSECYQGGAVWGMEYAKAIQETKINLGLLYEGGLGAPEGDLLTARTFEIPATGGFMLHERTKEVMSYFEEDKECAFYSDKDDLVAGIQHYLDHPEERRVIATAGRQRCLTSGYSVDSRIETVLAKYAELRAARVV
jgi:spore maturation protein CgeB